MKTHTCTGHYEGIFDGESDWLSPETSLLLIHYSWNRDKDTFSTSKMLRRLQSSETVCAWFVEFKYLLYKDSSISLAHGNQDNPQILGWSQKSQGAKGLIPGAPVKRISLVAWCAKALWWWSNHPLNFWDFGNPSSHVDILGYFLRVNVLNQTNHFTTVNLLN